MAAIVKVKAVAGSVIQPKSDIRLLVEVVKSEEILGEKLYVAKFAQYQSLEKLRNGTAKGADLRILQFYLYVAEELMNVWDGVPEDVTHAVSQAIECVYAIARMYNESGYKTLKTYPEWQDIIREALIISEEFHNITDRKTCQIVYQYVQNMLSVPPTK